MVIEINFIPLKNALEYEFIKNKHNYLANLVIH